MDTIRKQRIIRQLVGLELAEMKPTGRWGLTTAGQEFLDQLQVMHELSKVDRSGAAASSPVAAGSTAANRSGRARRDRGAVGRRKGA